MKKYLLIILFFLSFSSLTASALRPTIRTLTADTIAPCSIKQMTSTVDKFCYEFLTEMDSLFKWAYLNTDAAPEEQKTGKGQDAIRLQYGSPRFDRKTGKGTIPINIYFLGSQVTKGLHLSTSLTKKKLSSGKVFQQLDAEYSGSLLDSVKITWHMQELSPTTTKVHFSFSVECSRFLAGLISDKTWNNLAVWRLHAILDNLVEYAEKGYVSTPKDFAPKPKK